ncbi:tetratricopeptide repeat protein [Planctomycetota bacterium]
MRFFEGNWLGQVHMHLGEYDEAETLLMEVLEARKLKLSKNHPWTLGSINDLGVLRRERMNYVQAESLLHQALGGRKAELGDDHPACFESMRKFPGKWCDQLRLACSEGVNPSRIKTRNSLA